MTLANAAYLGIARFANDRNKENWATSSDVDKANLIRAVYQQVLGRQYVMASERLEGPESLFRRGYLSVREFVRQVAKSSLYKDRFFTNSNPYCFIELNFKHLLGRAPQNKAEMLQPNNPAHKHTSSKQTRRRRIVEVVVSCVWAGLEKRKRAGAQLPCNQLATNARPTCNERFANTV